MLFMIFCVDKPDHAALRAATRPAHLAYAKGLGDALRLAGPTTTADGAGMTGSLLLIEAADLAAAQAIVANDPYVKAGLFETALVRPWRQVVPAQS